MAALNFPSSPAVDQVYSANGWSWKWDGTTWVGAMQGSGYVDIPQNIQNGTYAFVLGDAGKHVYHTTGTAHTFTVPANSGTAFPIGTALTVITDSASGVVTIAITTDSMLFIGAGTTGSRLLAASGIATLVKVTSTRWTIGGTNIT